VDVLSPSIAIASTLKCVEGCIQIETAHVSVSGEMCLARVFGPNIPSNVHRC
jgi:hypothetical protein